MLKYTYKLYYILLKLLYVIGLSLIASIGLLHTSQSRPRVWREREFVTRVGFILYWAIPSFSATILIVLPFILGTILVYSFW